MDRVAEFQARLSLPDPFLLFYGIPPRAAVNGKVHGHLARATEMFAFDVGARPAAFNVPPGVSPPAVPLRIPQAKVIYATGGPVLPGPTRDDEYAYQYVWAAFGPPITGQVVPLGKAEVNMVMPANNLSPLPDELRVLRFRWRGTAIVGGLVGTGTGVVGPYTLTLAAGVPIVPGTVVVTAPRVIGGNCVARDWPWPKGNQRIDCIQGRMIGDVDPGLDSLINYETGIITIMFNSAIVNAVNNITANYEHTYTKQPMDVRISYITNN